MSGNKVQPADGGEKGMPAGDPNQDSVEKGLISDDALVSDAEGKKQAVADVTYRQIFSRFVLLGWTAFGGPAAHIALFQKIFVEQLGWISDTIFTEFLALGQCLPGPTSTQMSFALGTIWKGIGGGLATGALFQYPGLIMMSLVGVGAANFLVDPPAWFKGAVDGLSAAGVALVAAAAVGLVKGQCKDRTTTILCCLSATVAYYYQTAWLFPLLLLIGGLVTLTERWSKPIEADNEQLKELPIKIWQGSIIMGLWLVILIASILLRRIVAYEDAMPLHWFEAMFRTGSIIFGGGQVVLPLMIEEVNHDGCNSMECLDVPGGNGTSWVTVDQFYVGLGAAQAMPGPLFNLAAYLGAVIAMNVQWYQFGTVAGIATCWFGLFGPGILLIFGFFPFWGWFRNFPIYKKLLPGFNSTAVGLVVASVFQMFIKVRGVSSFPDAAVCIGTLAFGAVQAAKVPAPIALVASGVLGVIAWAADMH